MPNYYIYKTLYTIGIWVPNTIPSPNKNRTLIQITIKQFNFLGNLYKEIKFVEGTNGKFKAINSDE